MTVFVLKWITCQNSAFLHFSQFSDPVLNAEGIMVKFHCAINKGLSMFARWETRSVLYVRNTCPTVTIFRKTKTPPTNINLSPRHMTSLNQGLSSLVPFGVGKMKDPGIEIVSGANTAGSTKWLSFNTTHERGNVSMKRWKSHCSFTSCLMATINWRGEWNKALSDFWCNVKFSSSFTTEYKEIWKENVVIYQKSLKAFLLAPLQL